MGWFGVGEVKEEKVQLYYNLKNKTDKYFLIKKAEIKCFDLEIERFILLYAFFSGDSSI